MSITAPSRTTAAGAGAQRWRGDLAALIKPWTWVSKLDPHRLLRPIR